jgi:hypothetical protein
MSVFSRNYTLIMPVFLSNFLYPLYMYSLVLCVCSEIAARSQSTSPIAESINPWNPIAPPATSFATRTNPERSGITLGADGWTGFAANKPETAIDITMIIMITPKIIKTAAIARAKVFTESLLLD